MSSIPSNNEGSKKGMYIIGEIIEPHLDDKNHKNPRFLIITTLGTVLLIFAILIYIYSAGIMIYLDLRAQYWRWGFLSLALSLILLAISKYFRDVRGYSTFTNRYDKFVINNWLGSKEIIVKPEIYAISFTKRNVLFGLMKAGPVVLVSTYDKTYKIPLHRYRNKDQMIAFFKELQEHLQDDFYNVIQKADTSGNTMLLKVWNQMTGKIGLILILVYAFLTLWGAFSMLFYPSGTYASESFFLRNPELSNSFLPGYDSGSIIYVEPNDQFIMGTDFIGRDVFARLVYGTVHSLSVAILSSVILTVLVVVLGFTTAIQGGWWDRFISRIADTLLIFPPIIPIVILATFTSGIELDYPEQFYYYVFVGLAFVTWPQGMKLLRAETKRLLHEEYVAAARLLGASNYQILLKHVLPKTSPSIILIFIYSITDVIIGMTVVGILGLDLGSNLTWGSDLSRAIIFTDVPLEERWWTLIFPTLWIAGLVIGLTLVSDNIRDRYQLPTQISLSGGDDE